MKIFKVITVISILFLSSCQDEERKYNHDLIKPEKIDAILGNDVSKVLFDHLYVVLDSLTYEHLTNDNDWKKSYATLDGGLPDFTPIKKGSSICYLRGYQHYIEILGPNNIYNESVGKSGIGFSLVNKGEHFHLGVEPKLKTSKDSVLNVAEMVKMELNGKEQTWFKAFYTPSYGTALHTWYGFYNPTFLNDLNGENHLFYSRETFLEPTYEDSKLFHSVAAIQLSCTKNDFRRIAQELGYLKCELIEQDGEVFTIASGDIEISIEQSNKINYSRITEIKCNLNRVDNSVNQIGNLTITNKEKISVWNFSELHKNNIN